jgi:hypothetical protein
VDLTESERAIIQSAHREGSTVGTIRYRKPSVKDDVGGYFFESDTSDFETIVARTGADKESTVGELIRNKMVAAKTSTAAPLELFSSEGARIGSIANANPINDQIVEIGVRNLEQTQFNQTLGNLRKIDAATTAVTPIDASNINEVLSTTNRFYGLGLTEVTAGEENLVKGGMALGRVLSEQAMSDAEKARIGIPVSTATTKAETYSDELIKYNLPYSEMDPSSRAVGVATSRATAREFATAINLEKSSLGSTLGAMAGSESDFDKAVTETTKRLRQVSDMAPVNFAIAQGQEALYGYQFGLIDKEGAETSLPFAENLYFRMTGGQTSPFKSSEKITMVAEDFLGLSVDIGGKRVAVNSPEFLESAANRFIQSHVHESAAAVNFKVPTTINLIFNPKNLKQEAYEDLANQVVGAQVRRFQASRSSTDLAKSVKDDFNAISHRIFGMDYKSAEERLKIAGGNDFFEQLFAEGKTLAERKALLENIGMKEAATNFEDYVKSVAVEVRDDGIAAFKYMGESAENIREIQRMSGNEALALMNDQQTRSITTRVSSFVTAGEDGKVVGATMAPFGSEVASTDARVVSLAESGLSSEETAAKVVESMRESDVAALSSLEDSVRLIPSIDDAAVGTMIGDLTGGSAAGARAAAGGADIGTPIADEAFRAGAEFFIKNKRSIYLAGLAVSTAAIGTMMAKRKNENEVYDATMHRMPVESGERPYGIQDALFAQKMASRRKDPLVTAGVVGNLDRSKINHTSMGPDKNNHLFGG